MESVAFTQIRRSEETKCISTLRKAYPYGPNDKISDDIRSTNNQVG